MNCTRRMATQPVRLRKHFSCLTGFCIRAWYQAFVSPDWARRGAKCDPHLVLSTVHPSLAEPLRNLTLVFYLLVILVQIGFSLTINSRRFMLAASPESSAILRRRFGTLTQIATQPTPGPDSVAQEVSHDPQRHS